MTKSAGTVLLTGANGYIAVQILSDLITNNYHVIATVRTQAKAQQVLARHPTWKRNITFVYVPDMVAQRAYDEAFQVSEIDYIIHNASPVVFNPKDIQKDIIDPAIGGTMRLFEDAHKKGSSNLKRIILLGSAVSMLNSYELNKKPATYSEADWNPVTAEYATQNNDVVAGYCASKVAAERSAWDFVAQHNPSFDLVVLNPAFVIGPMQQPVFGPEDINFSISVPWGWIHKNPENIDDLRPPFNHFVDVRDVSRAHILSLTAPAASNKRILLISGHYTAQVALRSIKKQFPELKDRLSEGSTDVDHPGNYFPPEMDTSRSYEVFGKDWKYCDLDTALGDTVRDLLALEKKWAVKN